MRPVTIVFTDLTGFTPFTARHGDLAARDLVAFNALTLVAIVGARDGRIVKSLGDGHLLAFDDPVVAVAASIELASAVTSPLRLRVAAHWGRPLRTANDVIGHDVNVAARLLAMAGPGEVLISEALCDAAGAVPGVAYGPREQRAAKGIEAPIALHVAHAA
jgi:adenylate cyclase